MTPIQLINSFLEKKEAYLALGISNLWAAHLIALSTRYSQHKALIALAINPDEPTTNFRASKFIDTTPKTETKDNFGICKDCPQPAGVIGDSVKVVKSEDIQPLNSVAEILALYKTRQDLVRAAIQLDLKPHHKASDATIAAEILKALNEEK